MPKISSRVAVERGVRQYVVLGAGLDTFAYRNPFQSVGLHVFEVDHPATQEWKRARLRAAGIPIPERPDVCCRGLRTAIARRRLARRPASTNNSRRSSPGWASRLIFREPPSMPPCISSPSCLRRVAWYSITPWNDRFSAPNSNWRSMRWQRAWLAPGNRFNCSSIPRAQRRSGALGLRNDRGSGLRRDQRALFRRTRRWSGGHGRRALIRV